MCGRKFEGRPVGYVGSVWPDVLEAANAAISDSQWPTAAIFGLAGVALGGAISLLSEALGFRRQRKQTQVDRMVDNCAEAFAAIDQFILSLVGAASTRDNVKWDSARTTLFQSVSRVELVCPEEVDALFARFMDAVIAFEAEMGRAPDSKEFVKTEMVRINERNRQLRNDVRRIVRP